MVRAKAHIQSVATATKFEVQNFVNVSGQTLRSKEQKINYLISKQNGSKIIILSVVFASSFSTDFNICHRMITTLYFVLFCLHIFCFCF